MLKIALSTFVLVFLAELGAIESRAPWAVFLGAGSALLLSTAIAVGLGTVAVRVIPPGFTRLLHYVAGVLFILVGAWTIWKA
jgi:putative Ca2+/H+ antiporter (TMEM165/GDT1 family)